MSPIPFNKLLDVDIFPLSNVVGAFKKGKVRPQFLSQIVTLASRKVSDDKGTVGKFRFFLQFWKNLAKIDLANDAKFEMSVEFLRKNMDENKLKEFRDLLNCITSSSITFMMISMLVSTEDKEYKCIASLFLMCDGKAMYIFHVALMNGCYYHHNYGSGADEKPFRNRGIAKLLVGMVQSYLDCIVHSKILLCRCLTEGSNGQGSLWNSLGFQKVCPFQDNFDEAHEFVQPFLTFITQTDQKKSLMMIDCDVKFFTLLVN